MGSVKAPYQSIMKARNPMYSNEINDYLKARNFNITYDEIDMIKDCSPQVELKFEGIEDKHSVI